MKRIRKHLTFSRKRNRERIHIMQFLLPGLVGVGIFYLVPFADVVRRSFVQSTSGRFMGVENYRQVLENKAFWRAVENTAVYVGIYGW